eukprot:g10007.t1
MLHGFKKAKQDISNRIVEIPLRAIIDVTLVSGRERLKTFRSFQANSVSRPFRIVTSKAPSDEEMATLAATATLESKSNTFGVEGQHQVLLVGFEDVSRLRHFLVLACESWAVRTGGSFGGPAKELLSCSPVGAQRYLAAVFEAMTGQVRNQVDAQVELMEDLANELMLDSAVKEAFFSSGDIFLEIARRLEAAAATAEAASAAAAEDEKTVYTNDGFDRNVGGVPRRDSGQEVIRLFNIENEGLGVVRNLVGVGIGMDLRAGIQPAASDALAFLIRVNDRTVGLIEDLDRREKRRRRVEAERQLARGPAAASPVSENGEGSKRSVFSRLASLSPGSRPRRSLTPPLTPPGSPANLSAARSAVSDNGGGGLQHLLEEGRGRGGAEASGIGQEVPGQRRRGTQGFGFAGSPRGRRGGPLPPPVVHEDASQQLPSRNFLGSAPVLLHSYAKLLNSLVCGSYNLRAAYSSSCEADVRNIGREGGYLDMLAELDGGTPRMIFGQTALFLHEIMVECHL